MDKFIERPKVGVGVVVLSEGKLLLGKRKGAHGAGFWSTAGGHLEYGETVEECAKRELFEETGLLATSLILGPWTNNIIDGTKHYVTIFIFVDGYRGAVELKEPHKCEGWHWFDAEALPDPLFPTVVTMIEKVGIHTLKTTSSSAKRSD